MARVDRVVTNPVIRPLAAGAPAVGDRAPRRQEVRDGLPVARRRLPDPEGFPIPLAYGADRDWVRKVVATGSFELEQRGLSITVTEPVIHIDDVPAGIPSTMATTIRRLNLPGVVTVRR